MDKGSLLKACAAEFEAVLRAEAEIDWSLSRLLKDLKPLFEGIASGLVVPPCPGRFRTPFHIEDPVNGLESNLFRVSAAFESALEDSASQPWYQKAFGSPKS
jgi:hypothetical protein